MSSVLPFLWSNAPLVTGISNPIFAAPILLFSCAPLMTRSPEWISRLWRTHPRMIFVSLNLVVLIRFIVLANDCERLCCFTNGGLSLSYCCSWLKGEPPGTRTLAAGSQKKKVYKLWPKIHVCEIVRCRCKGVCTWKCAGLFMICQRMCIWSGMFMYLCLHFPHLIFQIHAEVINAKRKGRWVNVNECNMQA